ncbi:MAG: queuosine precursor transporter [Chloroflexota bacterium]|nr:queuosine precursor transporter [Chloroflexota bacterium]
MSPAAHDSRSAARPERSTFPTSIPGAVTTGSPYFLVVVALFVTSLITANTVAVKILAFGPWVSDAGLLTFPIAYIVGDVLTEVYGYAAARRVIWLGFLCNALAVGVFQLAGALPAEATWDGGDAYARIFGSTPRLLLASVCAYLLGEFVNAYILARLKVFTNGRYLWTRTISSTVVGQGLDTVVFVLIAFSGAMSGGILWDMIVTGWLLKSAYEILATPLTYLVVNTLKRIEGVDVYDRDTDFNPVPLNRPSPAL